MSDYAIDAFYLGSDAELDTFDGNWSVAQAFSLVGNTYGSGAAPLLQSHETVVLEDFSPDEGFFSTNTPHELHPLIAEPEQDPMDGALEYHVTIQTVDAERVQARMFVLQDDLGRLFLTPGRNAVPVMSQAVRSITIDHLAQDKMAWLCSDLEASNFVTSFLEGTRLMAAGGEVPVEQLEIGDLVQTLDHGVQPIVWMGCQHVVSGASEAPIRIGTGALGMGWPKRPLYVSPQHRVVVASEIAQQMFDQPQVLVPAKKLLGLPNISQCSVHRALTYWHVMTRAHEILFAESALVESFLPGPMALSALPERNRRDLFKHQPSLVFQEGKPNTARRCVEGARAEKLVERLRRASRPALEEHCLTRAASTGAWRRRADTRRAAAVRCYAGAAPALVESVTPQAAVTVWPPHQN